MNTNEPYTGECKDCYQHVLSPECDGHGIRAGEPCPHGKPMEKMNTNEPTTELVTYECRECGFIGSVEIVAKKATCPTCGTANDVWKAGEMPPPNHRNEPTTGEIVRALRNCMETFCNECICHVSTELKYCRKSELADRLESQEKTIADLRETLRITCENWSASSKEKNAKIAELSKTANQ